MTFAPVHGQGVAAQVGLVAVAFATLGAAEGLSQVDLHVVGHAVLSVKGLLADGAAERSLPRVHAQVSLQVEVGLEPETTEGTLVRSFLRDAAASSFTHFPHEVLMKHCAPR